MHGPHSRARDHVRLLQHERELFLLPLRGLPEPKPDPSRRRLTLLFPVPAFRPGRGAHIDPLTGVCVLPGNHLFLQLPLCGHEDLPQPQAKPLLGAGDGVRFPGAPSRRHCGDSRARRALHSFQHHQEPTVRDGGRVLLSGGAADPGGPVVGEGGLLLAQAHPPGQLLQHHSQGAQGHRA